VVKKRRKEQKEPFSAQMPLTLAQRSIRWPPLQTAPILGVVLRPNFRFKVETPAEEMLRWQKKSLKEISRT
jgi:hypothetical protein